MVAGEVKCLKFNSMKAALSVDTLTKAKYGPAAHLEVVDFPVDFDI